MFTPKKTIFLTAMALAILFMMTTTMVAAVEELKVEDEGKEGEKEASTLDSYLTSLRGVSSFFFEHKITCKSDPNICNVSGSPGPYCCKKVCVNIYSDHRNCGSCKNKCKNTQMCCSGRCTPAYKGCGTSSELAFQA